MGSLVPPEDLPQSPRLVPADDLPDAAPAAPRLSGWDKAVNMIGRGAWALPGLVGLDHETVQAWATGTPKAEQLKLSRQVDAENPITSGLVRGVAAAPGEALAWMAAPEAKIAQGAGALTKALTYGPRVGLLSGASEYGSTAHKDPGERALGAGTAAATGTVLGGGMAAALPNPAALFSPRPSYSPATAELAAAQAEARATTAARAASAADAAAQGGDAAARNASELVVKPSRPTLLSKALREPEPLPEAKYLAERGVRLTKGLNDPNSSYGAMEIASQSKGVTGPLIRQQRMRALEDAGHVGFEVARPPAPPPGATNLSPEEYLYHVTPAENAESIAKQGLRIDAQKIAEGGPHADTRAVFLADAKTVPTYRDLYGGGDAPVTVYRVPRSALSSLEDDTASEGAAYLSRENIPAELLERETPTGWSSVTGPRLRREVGRAGDINEKYVRLKGEWDEAFDAIRAKNELIQPSILEGDFGRPLRTVGDAPGVIDQIIDDTLDPEAAAWDDASRAQARKFIDNQFTRLNAARRDEAGRVPLRDMLKMLSDVRKFSRAALKGEKYDLHQIASRVEDAIEQAMETQASPATSKELRALNSKYRDFKVVEDAVIRAKDSPAGITPAQWEASVARMEPSRSRYAGGGGGELRTLSKAVRKVFDESGMPPTGARLGSIAPPWLHDMTIGPTIYLRNSSSASAQGGRAGARALSAANAAARAQTKAAAAAQQPDPSLLADFLSGYPIGKTSPSSLALAEAMQRKFGLRLPPATAEDDR